MRRLAKVNKLANVIKMIDYVTPYFRPPSEGKSFILQATIGCSHNQCTYCAMYREDGQRFRFRPMAEIKGIIDEASAAGLIRDRVFIADGNALVLSQMKLVEIISYLREKAPGSERIRMYANVGDILRKGVENLKELRALGLDMVYIGFESGDDIVLERIKKGANREETIKASGMLKEAEIMNSAMVLLGMGGVERSAVHAEATGRLLTACDPEYVGALSLQIRPGAPIYDEWKRGEFEHGAADPQGMYRHLGLYAYRVGFLRRYVEWEPAPIERQESLEQLRVLWQGERIAVAIAQQAPPAGIDTEEDYRRVLEHFQGSGNGR